MSKYIVQVSANEQARCSAAFGRRLNLRDANGVPRPATDAEVLEQIGNFLVGAVQEQEIAIAIQVAAANVPPITPQFP